MAGHADKVGTDAVNVQLTKRRAQAVVDALVKRQVDPRRLHSQGYGNFCQLDPGESEESRERKTGAWSSRSCASSGWRQALRSVANRPRSGASSARACPRTRRRKPSSKRSRRSILLSHLPRVRRCKPRRTARRRANRSPSPIASAGRAQASCETRGGQASRPQAGEPQARRRSRTQRRSSSRSQTQSRIASSSGSPEPSRAPHPHRSRSGRPARRASARWSGCEGHRSEAGQAGSRVRAPAEVERFWKWLVRRNIARERNATVAHHEQAPGFGGGLSKEDRAVAEGQSHRARWTS